MDDDKVKLIECIRTWQGECIDSGQAALLCRFKYCNKACKFCDTLIKMRVSKESEYSIKELQKEITENKLGIMITGGEPTIDKHFQDTLALLNKLEYTYANVETNGHQLKKLLGAVNPDKPVKYIYSPKIFDITDLEEEKARSKDLIKYANVFIKVVYEERTYIVDRVFTHSINYSYVDK